MKVIIAVATLPITLTSPIVLSQSSMENNVIENTYFAQHNRKDHLRELLERGRKLAEAKEYQEATQVYQQAARLDGDNARIFSGLGYLEARQGNYKAAAWAYRRAINLNPNNAEFYYALGHTLAKIQDYSAATTAYYRSTELDPKKVPAYLGLGAVLLRQNDRAGAIAIYEKLLEIEPNHPEANAIIGSLLVQQGNYPRAIAHLEKTIKLTPETTAAWLDLTTAYQQQGKFPFALKTIETFLQRYPNHSRGYYQKGKLLQQYGEINAAASAYKQAINLDSKSVEALIALGEVQLKQEQYSDAVNTYQRLKQFVPDNPAIYYNLGLALKGRDRVSEARKAFQTAYQLFTEVQNQDGKDRSQMQLRNL